MIDDVDLDVHVQSGLGHKEPLPLSLFQAHVQPFANRSVCVHTSRLF